MRRSLYFGLGISCLLLGVIGVVLPLLPTTPFVILAAFCFSRSSPRFHAMLLNHRLFGPIISEWEQYGVIPLKVKIFSSSMMLLMISYPIFFKQLPLWIDLSMALTALIALLYIWSRPSIRTPAGQAER
ncbi:MAG: YbaN family protein [Halopseudomonas sp.]